MKLSELLRDVSIKGDFPDHDVSGVSCDSKRVKKGDVFVCLSGNRHDGHDYASEALRQGAKLIVAERYPTDCDKSRVILTESTAKAASRMWYNYFGRPAQGMTKIAVTGTAGKTSVVFLLRELLRADGHKVGIISTICAMSEERKISLGDNGGSSVGGVYGAMTTPDPEYFWYAVSEMKNDGCDVLIYEASSQAIVRETTSAVIPDLCVFTNLSEEHLDAHGSMENYFRAKSRLLCGVKKAVINIDDDYFSTLPEKFRDCNFITVSACRENAGKSDVCALRYRSHGEDGIEYVYFSENAVFRVKSRQIGFYSVYNTMEAAACAVYLGVDPVTVQEVLARFSGADGRMQRVVYKASNGQKLPRVYIDYAHTPRSLEAACRSLWEIRNAISDGEHKLIAVFGCGGDRDKSKRPLMAAAAQKYADLVVITSDNPRSENPTEIINDILCGTDKEKPYVTIPDRRTAIKYAIEHAGEGDLILLAGKGHEKYEITSRSVKPFDEEKAVCEIFDTLCGNNNLCGN